MVNTLLVLVSFLAATLTVFAGCHALSRYLFRDVSIVRRRVSSEFGKGSGDPRPLSTLFLDLDQLSLDRAPVDPFGAEADGARGPSRRSLEKRLGDLIRQAGLRVRPLYLLLTSVGLGLGCGVVGTLLRGPLLGGVLALLAAAAPLTVVYYRRKARREKLLAQLPIAFDLMARVIRTGQSVPQALQSVADSLEEPIASEFAACQQRQNLGLRPEVTFREMAERTGILEVRIFVMAMLIHRLTGGNLSEVLERLAGLVRDRLRLRRQIHTLTAEGRLQGLTLLILPFLVFGVMMLLNREYAEVLLEHGWLLAATLGAMTVGMVWIRQIVNVEP